jgi:SAM-dependent methyltransferase
MNAEMYALHDLHEENHWWFAARRQIVLHLLRQQLGDSGAPLRLLDIGCGAGGMLKHLRVFGDVIGVEPSPDAVAYAAAKGVADVRMGTLPDGLPFSPLERFDAITLLDVLEHVEEDVASLAALQRLLRPRGLLLLTVPAYQFLWSSHDVANRHQRRYSRALLHERLVTAGFEVATLSYYNTLLFPPVAAIRLVKRFVGGPESPDLGSVPRPLNAVLRSVFAAERHVLGSVPLPFGVSLIATARPRIGKGAR